jgi:hypothetical protein
MCSNDEFDLRHLLTDARSRAFDSRLRDIYFFCLFFSLVFLLRGFFGGAVSVRCSLFLFGHFFGRVLPWKS